MKIARLDLRRLAGVPVTPPGAQRPLHEDMLLLAVESEDGLRGIAEIRYGPLGTLGHFLREELFPLVRGESALDTERLSIRLARTLDVRERGGLLEAASSALDVALWDLKARSLGVPLWRLLGGAQPSVPAYVTFGLRSYDRDALAAAARHWTAQGHRRLKMMVGRLDVDGRLDRRGAGGAQREENPGEDVARVRAVRDAIGDETQLAVDAACLLPFEAAVRWCRALEPFGLAWFEEPLATNDPLLLADLRRRTAIPISAGQWENFRKLADLVRHGAVDILNPTVGAAGGFTLALKAAGMAQAANLPIANGGIFDVHLHGAVANGWRSEIHALEWLSSQVIYEGLPLVDDGRIILSDRPGVGMTWREDAVREFAVD